ncbi:major capsid protein [Capybara microvirus Cap1_SP_162]|nr:major capsid protein [Capybara microvirus Cap1_SP_162]
MNRNTEMHFASNPTSLDMPRSKFKIPHSHKTTINTGELNPIFCMEYLPGDTAKIDLATLCRMMTPVYPVLDNAWMDIYFFSVPNRLVWDHWKEFMGENTTSYWTQQIEYTMPQTTAPQGGWQKGTIADKLNLPIGVEGISVSSLPFRAVALCYNEWFRSENLVEPLDISKGEATTAGSNGSDAVTDVQAGGMPPKVARLADMFSTALPQPQKGPDVYIPLGNKAPIIYTRPIDEGSYTVQENLLGKKAAVIKDQTYSTTVTTSEGNTLIQSSKKMGLEADLSTAVGATINQLRQAFAIQRMYEKDARGGTRYTELIRSHFSVISPDARQQRPEYLGGKRIPINITQVLQTSATDSTSPQGNTAAMSLTIDNDSMFTKSFTEHGYILGFACIRTDRSYSQGIERHWSRKSREDYYFPTLANIGEVYIKNKEIYAQGTDEDEEAFGYQEAWYEYRMKPNVISGELRPAYAQSLDAWHYGDKYAALPTLSAEWLSEGKENVERTLAVQNQDQFICDFYFDMTWTRPMPIYSIPGLIDHH